MFLVAGACVWAFFTISGYVLTAAWDGRYTAFLVRRAVRLWPIYALCLAVGAALIGTHLPVLQYAWLPISNPNTAPAADPPAWSLTVEAWAMLAMPAYVWISRRRLVWLAGALAACALLSQLWAPMILLCFFFAGAWLTRCPVRWAPLEGAIPQWLGRVSYPLYLCHWPILAALGLPLWASIPLAFVVAEGLARTVEKWSIKASRIAGNMGRTYRGQTFQLP